MFKSSETTKPVVVCILGMHRSGTSLTARILSLIGVNLGSEERFKSPRQDNPTGFWEHGDIGAINDAILEMHGGSWQDPPHLPDGWESAPILDDLRERAQTLIADQFDNLPLWGWKDPRGCLTLPFWQQLMPEMRYVICLRNPLDVAHSLLQRDGFSAEKSSALWLSHVNSAFVHSEGKPRLVIFYEDLINNCQLELQRLSEFIGMPEQATRMDVRDAVTEFTQKELQHYQTSMSQTLSNPAIAVGAKAVYVAHRIAARWASSETADAQTPAHQTEISLESLGQDSSRAAVGPQVLKEQLRVLLRLQSEVGIAVCAQLAESDARLQESDAQLLESDARLGHKEELVKMLSTKLVEQDRVFHQLETQLLERDGTIESLSSRLTKQDDTAVTQAERVEERVAQLSAQLLDTELQLETMRNTLGWRALSIFGWLKFRVFPIHRRADQLRGKRPDPQTTNSAAR
jgi:hypothetical protein